ncbi:MAG: dolichol monophosphate mannose synthase [Mucilaginibacter sp.]|nr:dolichol monophosphate mannose synthase [Mucilaginibacter sp.]
MSFISIVTPCYNEEENVENLYLQVKEVFNSLPDYTYEHIFIDNFSSDGTVSILKKLGDKDKNIKIIVNARNFGHIRSPYYALLQSNGDAVILIVADLQDPPVMIIDFIKKWEEGYKIAIGVKTESNENKIMFFIRKVFYNIISKISEIDQIKNFTGFGLYDKKFIDVLRELEDPYPYFRGLIAELGFNKIEIPYTQPKREKGKTKNNFYTLYDIAMLGFVSHSKIPLRLASFIGFSVSILSMLVAFSYFLYKIFDWYNFQLGIAPLVIGIFFLGGVQLLFLGIIGEYIGTILTQVKKRPLVIEKERINFN